MINKIIGFFSEKKDAERAMYDLDTLGYDPDEMSILTEEKQAKKHGILNYFASVLTGKAKVGKEVTVAVAARSGKNEKEVKEVFEAYNGENIRTIQKNYYQTPAFYSDIRKPKKLKFAAKRKVF